MFDRRMIPSPSRVSIFFLVVACGFIVLHVLKGDIPFPEKPTVDRAAAQAAVPTMLHIPRIGVDADIEPLGLTAGGDMDVPKDPLHVSWYKFGARPGEQGSSVLAGHLDTAQGKPAIFWRLRELEVGDTITVDDEDGHSRTFLVEKKDVYPADHAPLEEIFGETPSTVLRLITCNGVWNTKSGTYSQRTVISATLVAGD